MSLVQIELDSIQKELCMPILENYFVLIAT